MIDRYSVEKLIDRHTAEALKTAAQDRLASQAADRPKHKRPGRRRVWSLAGKLRALAFAGARPLAAVAEQRKS